MNVCVVAEYYPRRRDPVLGVWAHRQALAARAAGADVAVLALERPLPPLNAVREATRGRPGPLVRAVGGIATQPRRDELDGIEVEYVRFVSPPRGSSYAGWHRWARAPLARALARLDARRPLDLVHAHYALPAGGAALPFCARRGLALAVSVHGGDVYLEQPLFRARVGAVLRAADAVLCNSARTLARAAALAGTRGERMRVVHLGAEAPAGAEVEAGAGADTAGANGGRPTVATLGHLIPRKRHADVARALALVRERGSLPEPPRWLVIGDGPELPALRALCERLGLGDVELAGELEHDEALRALARCRLMALPSVNEAFGVAYAEALACGVPAIGCRGEGGPEEIAALGEGMLLVPPGDPPALAEAIEGALRDPRRLGELSRAARRTAAENFSWERCGEATVAAYEEALAG